jgi:transposase
MPHRCDVGPGPSAWYRRKRATQNQAIGKSRGGLTTKIAVIVDALGNLIRFVLLPGQRHDITSFDALMAGIYCLALIGDKGFDAGWLRERLRANDMEAVIPLREGTSGYAEHDREKYKWRHLVENFFCSIKAFRRIATRYEKTDKCFAAIINPVTAAQHGCSDTSKQENLFEFGLVEQSGGGEQHHAHEVREACRLHLRHAARAVNLDCAYIEAEIIGD